MPDPENNVSQIEKFPKKFDSCPNCGSKRRLTEFIIEQQVKDGKTVHAMARFQPLSAMIMVDPKFQLILTSSKVKSPASDIDVCIDCGTIYATAINIVDVQMNAAPKGPGGQVPPGFPPQFPGYPANPGNS